MSVQSADGVEVKKELKLRLIDIIWEEVPEWLNSRGDTHLSDLFDNVAKDDWDLGEAITIAAREESDEAFMKAASEYSQRSLDQTVLVFYQALRKEAFEVLRRARSGHEIFLRLTRAEEEEYNRDGEWLRQARSALAYCLNNC
jgi:hypothetical protein